MPRLIDIVEQEALKKFNDAVPDYIIGECINAARELPPMTKLIVTMDSSGHIFRRGVIRTIVEDPIDISFELQRETLKTVDIIYGRVIHNGDDFELRVMSYDPQIVMRFDQ